jgi:hypothetical protein
MPAIPVNKVVEEIIIIGEKGGRGEGEELWVAGLKSNFLNTLFLG